MGKSKILFLGKIPPPYIGPAQATKIILNSGLKDHFKIIHLDTSDHRDIRTLGLIDIQNIYLAITHYLKLIWLILVQKPDVVYMPVGQTTLSYLRDACFILISKIFQKKVVCHLRGSNYRNWYNSARSVTKWFVRSVHSLIDGQIVLGNKLIDLFSWLLPLNKIFVVPNGGNFGFKISSGNNTVPRILFLSNLQPSKGIEDVIKAVTMLNGNRSAAFHMDVVGMWRDDMTRNKCFQIADEYNLPISFHPATWGSNKLDFYQNADIFIFPPRGPEGHPWVIVEAMAAGLPIISTDQGAITESVIDGCNGFIVEAGNPMQIADKINLLVETLDLRKKMARESRKLYEDKFTEEKMVERLTNVFNTVLNR